jgi:hypothetical protein
MRQRIEREPKCGMCLHANDINYPGTLVCYETEEHPGKAIKVSERQQACRRYRPGDYE